MPPEGPPGMPPEGPPRRPLLQCILPAGRTIKCSFDAYEAAVCPHFVLRRGRLRLRDRKKEDREAERQLGHLGRRRV